jgi:phospholipid/cholesterol/gamma-HCH transport system permease protein
MAPWSVARDDGRIRIFGTLRVSDARAIWRALQQAARGRGAGDTLALDLSSVIAADGTTAALVVEFRNALVARGVRSEIVGIPEHLQPLLRLYREQDVLPPYRPAATGPHRGHVAQLAAAGRRIIARIRGPVAFVGELVDAMVHALRERRIGMARSLAQLIERAAADGVPIVLLLDFLVGFVIAFQTMPQLELYGANLYVADIVGISVTRELVPLMTAVIMAGRSGAAFAAELGTMRVNEEIDALRTMGISPISHLVVPRVLALVVAAPVLTLLGDVAAIAGGLLVGVVSLGLTPRSFLTELQIVLVPSDVWTGLVKSIVFGATIALIGCHQGLATTGSAEGVGRRTTSTVVLCLFAIVVFDTVLTIVFRAVGV